MSSLFKCCTCAKKNKYDDDEKRPKEKKPKKKKFGRSKKTKDSRKDEDAALVKPFDTVPNLQKEDDKTTSDNTSQNKNNDTSQPPKTINIPVININSYDDDTNKPHPSNNYFDEYYNNYKHNQSVSPPQHENRFSSEVDEDDDGADDNDSYLTDSDLNISEAVFVSEVGPYVSAGTLNRSRNLINSFRPTYDNEKSLEADLIERASLSDRKHPDSGVTSIIDSSNGVAVYA